MAKLELVDISKKYGNWKLGPVSVTLNDDESLTILGPTGSGKSTLLKIIAGIEMPDDGKVLVDGKDITNLPIYERDIGMIFQDYSLFPHLTAKENIYFGLDNIPLSNNKKESLFNNIIKTLHIEKLMNKYPHQLSGGEKQRIAIARSVVMKPSFLLCDEPLSSVDSRTREELRSELKSLQYTDHIQMVYVTHDHLEGMFIGDKIMIINEGKVEQVSSSTDIYMHPKTPFVAWFVGLNVLNIDNKRIAVDPFDIEISDDGIIEGHVISGRYIYNTWIGYVKVGNQMIKLQSYSDQLKYIGKDVKIKIKRYINL
ncbi:MAG: ABC transporter ATP-binding protein [Thermoplasmata archaeon]